MTTQYFIRYSDSEQWLQNDATRGYSFNFYKFAATPEELLEDEGYDLDECDVEALTDELNIMEHSNGSYGFALNGLCGYGPFETIEQARENAMSAYGIYSICGIYEGHEAGLDSDLSQLFRPTALVETFNTKVAVAA